jgi:large repetitive protein
VNEDQRLSIAAPGLLANDSDPDGDTLAVAPGFSFPDHAAGFGLSADGSFEYAPTANYNGTDFFVYQARDGATDSNLAPVTIAVSPVNDAPSFDLGEDQTVTNTSGAQTVEGFATNIREWAPGTAG